MVEYYIYGRVLYIYGKSIIYIYGRVLYIW